MKEKKHFNINGIVIYRILAYFIIYSILGFVLETIFALIVYGKLESRQGFLYGPVCPIYGVGAVVLIIALQKFKKNGYTLFFGGFVVGSVVEFVISLIGEFIFNVRWWDYSNRFLNIDGRICLLYSIYWGLISIFLMKQINPMVNRLIELLKQKMSIKKLKVITIILIFLLLIDFLISGFVIHVFLARTVVENNLEVSNKESYEQTYKNIYKNQTIERLMNEIWNEQFIVKVYPNLKLRLKDGTDVLIQDYYKNVVPYYYKFENNS